MAVEDDEVENGANPGTLALLALFFLPAGVTAFGFYLLLRKGRLRLSSVFQVFLLFEALIAFLWMATGSTKDLLGVITNPTDIGARWTGIIVPLVLFYSALGGLAGLAIVWWEIRQMKTNPHRMELKGNWQYHFQFRRGLTQVLRRKKRIDGLKRGVFVTEDSAPLGLNEEEEDRVTSRYYAEASLHTLISGASGSGKSISMQSLIRADIQNHIPTVVIDFKRSPEFASKLAAWAHEEGVDFYHFVNGELHDYDIKHSEGPVRYDPLSGGSPTAKADMVLGMREYDTASAVYRANMQQLLQVLFSMLHYANRSKAPSIRWENGGIYQLASAVAKDNFTELAIACENTPIQTEAQEVAEQLKGKTGLRHAMEELQGQVRTIIASEYGQWMKTSPTDRGLDLFELTSKPGNVLLFSLNSDSEPEFAKYVGSMILADITNTSAKRRNQQMKNQVNIYVDEFQAVNPTAVTGLLEKSRESKMAVTLAQQSFEQVVASAPQNGEAYLLSILDTCSNFIIHNGMTEDSAERLSKILGKHWVTKYRSTNKNQSFFLSVNWKNKRDSVVTTAEEEVWVFPPRKFMTLMSPSEANGYKSTAVLINKSCSDPAYAGREGAVARRVWMLPDNAVLDTYYDKTYRLQTANETSRISIVHDDGSDVPVMRETDLDFAPATPSNDWQEIIPQDYDFLAEAQAAKKARLAQQASPDDAFTPVDDPDDGDGGFGFERLEPEVSELAAYKSELEDRPTVEDEPELTLPAIAADPLSQFSADRIGPPPKKRLPPPPATRRPARLPAQPAKPAARSTPAPAPQAPASPAARPSGGLPVPPPRANPASTPAPAPERGLPVKPKAQDGGEAEELTLPSL